ncbi:hypothetical protein B0G84_1822 [Paraburkholderia sp. BL8N3]|nr:hypothetical protein [Paraburkholderia sp. BL8N3]TCK43486.1 hypothetical protein B0G84_1822 [Paraburkholderia sp. BL8N3]
MSGGETDGVARLAEKASKELFDWFKWDRVPVMDQNFVCVKKDKHSPRKKGDHTHPVDVVFSYIDPYLGLRILLNTDLKSYAKGSISSGSVRAALRSLAHTIDCARVSEDWRTRYELTDELSEIRGMLFVYNHDAEYDRDFMLMLEDKKAKPKDVAIGEDVGMTTETLPVEANQVLHIVDPQLITYMTTIIGDSQRLHTEGTFPEKDYFFHYPDLKLHKTHGSKPSRAATIEMIAGPYLIIEHGAVKKYSEINGVVEEKFPPGFVVYYNRPGITHFEFMYLFDTLSSFQILDGAHPIRIRVAHPNPAKSIRSSFKKAIEMYVSDWKFDDYKKKRLEQIEIELIEVRKTTFSQEDIKWDREEK